MLAFAVGVWFRSCGLADCLIRIFGCCVLWFGVVQVAWVGGWVLVMTEFSFCVGMLSGDSFGAAGCSG